MALCAQRTTLVETLPMHAPFTVNSNGARIVVEVQGEGPPLIFAHGLTGHRRTTQAQLAPLVDRYTVISFDQRGHGESSPLTEPGAYEVSLMAEDMAQVMNALSIERAIVGGESMGSATALEFAMRYPERVSHLLLTAPAFGGEESTEQERFIRIANTIRSVGLKEFVEAARQVWTSDFGWSEEAATTLGNSFLAHNADSIAMAMDTVMAWAPITSLEKLRTVQCPVCMIYWNDDALHPAALAHQLVDYFPNARLVEIAPLPEIFVNPGRIGEIYGDFLASAS